jgi:DNA-binding NarL/FixJ family response regulator
MEKARIFVVDDHPAVRQGLVEVLEVQDDLSVCGSADCAARALRDIPSACPDLVIVDVSLGDTSGLDLLKVLHARLPGLPVLILSAHDECAFAERAVSEGARGYIMKQASVPELLRAVRVVLAGETYLSREMVERLGNTRRADRGVRLPDGP